VHASAGLERAALVCVLAGVLVLMAGAFVALPPGASAAALACALAGSAWLAFAQRSMRLTLLTAWLALGYATPLVLHTPHEPGGSGVLLTLVAYAALVLGSVWLGDRDAPGAAQHSRPTRR
jgi:hypothetical protein